MSNVMQSNYAAVSVPVVTVSKANTSWSNQKSAADHARSFRMDAGGRRIQLAVSRRLLQSILVSSLGQIIVLFWWEIL